MDLKCKICEKLYFRKSILKHMGHILSIKTHDRTDLEVLEIQKNVTRKKFTCYLVLKKFAKLDLK